MPRKFRAKTGAERARKFRRIHTLTDKIAKLEKILAEIALHKLIRFKLTRLLQESHRQLARLQGHRFNKDTLNRISSSDQTVRSDGSISASAMHEISQEIGFEFEKGCRIGTLVGAGPVNKPRFRTPPWLLDMQRMKELLKHFRKTRRRTAIIDIRLLLGYYIFNRSDDDLYLSLRRPLDRNGNRIFRVKLDKQDGYTNLQRYRERLVRIGYEFFKMEVPDWPAIRKEQKLRARSVLYGRGTDPIIWLRENDEPENTDHYDQGSVEDEAHRRIAYLEQKAREKDPGRAKRLEAERRELSPEKQEFDRQLQRRIDLADRGRVTALYNEFFGSTRNELTEKSSTPARSKSELSGTMTNSGEVQSSEPDIQEAA